MGKDQLHSFKAVHLRSIVAIYSSYQIISNIQHIQSWDLCNGPLKWHLEYQLHYIEESMFYHFAKV